MDEDIEITYAAKGYADDPPNRKFLSLNDIKDGIVRKDTIMQN